MHTACHDMYIGVVASAAVAVRGIAIITITGYKQLIPTLFESES